MSVRRVQIKNHIKAGDGEVQKKKRKRLPTPVLTDDVHPSGEAQDSDWLSQLMFASDLSTLTTSGLPSPVKRPWKWGVPFHKKLQWNCQALVHVPNPLSQQAPNTDPKFRPSLNKHCEILVSCSDKERNGIQAHETACKPMELHASPWNFMQSQETACKLWELHASSLTCMKGHVIPCKPM